MWQVTVRRPDGTEDHWELGPDEGIVVGRDPGADMVLESKKVSRRHARFYTEGERLFLEDLDSQNGTFVGGARIKGANEIRPGPPVDVGEFRIAVKRMEGRVRTAAQPAPDTAPSHAAPAVLRGTGPQNGREFVLAERSAVGREAGMVVLLEDDSVSRRHGEIRREAGRWVVRDLGSANGTFLNGARISPNADLPLKSGDKLRFGETDWQIELPGGAGAAAPDPRRRKVLLAALLVVCVVVAAMWSLRPPPRPPPEEVSEQTDPAAEALARGQAAMESDRFEEARRAFSEAATEDPFNQDARMMLRRATRELDAQKAVTDAKTKSDVGRNQEAIDLLFKIDTDSRFFARARLQAQELAHAMMRQDLPRCRDAGRRDNTKQALETCARYMEYACLEGGDDDALKVLRRAEAAAGVREAWQCPTRLAPWFGGAAKTTADAAREVAARYSSKELRDAVLAYIAGEMDNAKKAAARAARAGEKKGAADLNEALAIVEGRFKEGQTAVAKHDLSGMDEAFKAAIDADARIVPATVSSFYRRQIGASAAREYFRSGSGKFDKSSYVEAWEDWSRGLGFDRNDSDLLDGVAKLEKVAEGMLSRGGAECDTLLKVMRITRAEPESPSHARARELATKKDCGE